MEVNVQTTRLHTHAGLFNDYRPLALACDEFFSPSLKHMTELDEIRRLFDQIPHNQFVKLQRQALELFKEGGVTFNVYSDHHGHEKIFPFDLIPRIIGTQEWQIIDKGLKQRVHALNLFLSDIYGTQKIIADGVIPRDVILTSKGFIPKLVGISPPGGIYIHIAGIDLLREGNQLMVLEDNLKVPSGISYVLENRKMSKRLLPNIFAEVPIRSVDDYPLQLKHALTSLCEPHKNSMAVLTPGPYNSAYFEHAYLAYHMGCPLVQNSDLTVIDDKVYLHTNDGLKVIDILYRRIDDEFIDPEFFRADSLLGVPGMMRAYRAGNVLLANAPGNGIADDKGIYPYVPKIIRYYLGEEALLPQVETYSCLIDKEREHVLNHLSKLVIKVVDQSGGYGIVIGEQASKLELEKLHKEISANPRNYIAQPLIQLSTSPTLTGDKIAPRHIDFRPFTLSGKSMWVVPGGLTRVALKKGSYIVNSSQGGGSKDTWIIGAS